MSLFVDPVVSPRQRRRKMNGLKTYTRRLQFPTKSFEFRHESFE